MTFEKQPLRGPRRFQWNAGGWFGSSFGGSAWILVTAGFLVFHDELALAMVLACLFAMVTAASVFLWRRRDQVYPFGAYMVYLCLLALVIPSAWLVITFNASADALAAMDWPVSNGTLFFVVSLAPVLMIWFVILENSTPPGRPVQTLDKPT